MKQTLRLLDQVRIASPCPMLWEEMQGDSRTRYCNQCRLNVFNLSELTDGEAEELLRRHQGRRLCAIYYQRADGTILTKDCRGGLAIVRKRLFKVATVTAAFLVGSFALAITTVKGGAEPDNRAAKEKIIETARGMPVIGAAVDKAFPKPPLPVTTRLGRVAPGAMMVPAMPPPATGSKPGAAPGP